MNLPAEHYLTRVEAQLPACFDGRPVLSCQELLQRLTHLNPAAQATTLDVCRHPLALRNELVHAGRGR